MARLMFLDTMPVTRVFKESSEDRASARSERGSQFQALWLSALICPTGYGGRLAGSAGPPASHMSETC